MSASARATGGTEGAQVADAAPGHADTIPTGVAANLSSDEPEVSRMLGGSPGPQDPRHSHATAPASGGDSDRDADGAADGAIGADSAIAGDSSAEAATESAGASTPQTRSKKKSKSGSASCSRKRKGRRRKRDPKDFTAEGSGDRGGRLVKALGTRWAPMDIPPRRRLQTFMILFALTLLPITQTLLTALFFLPQLRPFYTRELVVLFLLWTYVWDRKTPTHAGRPFRWLRNLGCWRYLREYYPAHLVVTEKLDNKRLHMFGIHPHGIIGAGTVANLILNGDAASEKLGGLDFRVLTVTFNFLVPLWRDILMGLRFVSASRSSATEVLRRGINCMVVVGGARESLDARPGVVDLTLNRRTGFVRLALIHGARLVPVYTFGENELWEQVDNPSGSFVRRVQMWCMRWMGFTAPVFYGRGVFQYKWGILPHRRAVTTVVGKAIEVPKIDSPKPDVIERYQKLYIKGLKELYEEHKERFEHPLDAMGRPIKSQGMRIVA